MNGWELALELMAVMLAVIAIVIACVALSDREGARDVAFRDVADRRLQMAQSQPPESVVEFGPHGASRVPSPGDPATVRQESAS